MTTQAGPGEGRRGPRTSLVIGGTLGAVALAAGAVLAVDRWVLASGDDAATAPSTTVDAGIDVEPVVGSSATKVIDRTTAAGIQVRVHLSDDPTIMGFPQGGGASPAWCTVTSLAMVSAVSSEAVAQSQMPITREPAPRGSVSQFWGGQLEGSPLFGVLLQVPADVTRVRATLAGGGADEMEPVDGLAALAMTAPAAAEGANPFDMPSVNASVDLVRSDGSSTRVTRDALTMGPPVWSDPTCTQANFGDGGPPPSPEPPPLPPVSGLEPADPDAAVSAIQAAMGDVYAPGVEADARRVELIDDPGGVQFAVDHVREFGGTERLDDMRLEFGELVFLSDVEASFLYTLTIGDQGEIYSFEYGRARLLGGGWKITRATYCQDIAHLGWNCGP